MNHLDLFSGIGGFALAAQRVGWRTIGFSEIEPYACKILARHWPDVPNHGDIRGLRGVCADLVTGGFPCQPFSLAGKRRGAADHRHLWPEMLRVIDEARPTWVLGENVPGIIGLELDRCLADLEGIGYAAAPIVIPACAVDAPHRRARVWIVANSTSGRRSGAHEWQVEQSGRIEAVGDSNSQRLEGQRLPIQPGRSQQAIAEVDGPGAPLAHPTQQHRPVAGREASEPGWSGQVDADLIGERLQNRDETGPAAPATDRPSDGSDCSRWPAEPGVGRVADGIPRRVDRLRALGNAIVPQVAEVILQNIWKIEHDPEKDTNEPATRARVL